jgi:hypothetical protein
MKKCIVKNGIMYFLAHGSVWEVASTLSCDLEVYRMEQATPCDSPEPEVVRLLKAGG